MTLLDDTRRDDVPRAHGPTEVAPAPAAIAGARRTPARHRGPSRRRTERAVVVGIVGAAAVTGALAEASPTGLAMADAAYRATYAGLVTLACAGSRSWTWPVVAGSALLTGRTGAWGVAAAAALVTSIPSQLPARRPAPVGAVIGALGAQALLRIPDVGVFGVPSAIAFVTALPAFVSAARLAGPRARTVLVTSGRAAAVLGLLALGTFAAGAALIRSEAETAVRHARAGLVALGEGDELAAERHFGESATSFAAASDATRAWWMRPLRGAPVLSQHLVAARLAADEGRRLAELSADLAPAASMDGLTTADGRFRLDRIAELEPLATAVLTGLQRGESSLRGLSSDWLLPPAASAIDEVTREITHTLPAADTAAEALALAPRLLGADGPRTYVVLFANPAEARDMGGFVASAGVLVADDGRLTFDALDPPAQLSRVLRGSGAVLELPVPDPVTAAQPQDHVENWTDSPDIGTVADVTSQLLPRITGGPAVDGVLYVDTHVLAALLRLSGPVTIPATGFELTADNAVDHLMRDQYSSPGFERGDARKERLGIAGEMAFDQLLSGRFPHPRKLIDTLSPLVRGRRLLFSTTDPFAHGLLTAVGLRPPMREAPGETIVVTHGNRRPGKLDAYLRRSIDYRAEVDASGATVATLEVALTSAAPADGLVEHQLAQPRPSDETPRTSNQLTLSVHSSMALTSVTVDGEQVGVTSSTAYELEQHSVPVTVPAGATVRVRLGLTGTVAPHSCTFSFVPNASANPDRLRATVEAPAGGSRLDDQVLDERTTLACAR